jgi:phage head maturation protease
MKIDTELLMRLFGTEELEQVLRNKEELVERARPIKPKVHKVKLTAAECQKLCNAVKLEYEDGYEERVFEYVFTDEHVDRYGDIVKADGGDLRNYKANPIVLAFHNGRALPVGMCLKIWLDSEKKEIRGHVLVYDQNIDPTGFCDVIYNYVSSGAMKTGSIGFIPKEGGVKRPSDEEREQMKLPRFGVIYEAWELLEFSLTPVPANPGATMKDCDLVEAFHREGVEDTAELERILSTEAPPAPEAPVQVVEQRTTADPELLKMLATIATNLNLLIEKNDCVITSNERLMDTLRECYRLSPSDGEQTDGEDEPELYTEDTVEGMENAFKDFKV